jgi:mannan endo-1,4-beta-mannosidase
MLLVLAGCNDGIVVDQTNTQFDDVEYTAESRPLGIIAGDDFDVLPGAEAVISGRLTGDVTDQTVLWTQNSGPDVGITNWTTPTLTFTAPLVSTVLEFTICAIAADGVTVVQAQGHFEFEDGDDLCDSVTINVVDPATFLYFEAEDGVLTTGLSVLTTASGYHGSGYVSDMLPGGSITLSINLAQSGFYSAYFGFRSQYGEKGFRVSIDGVPFVGMLPGTTSFMEFPLGTYNLDAGAHTIEICCEWNYYESDYIKLVPAPQPPTPINVDPTPINANATVEAEELKAYLVDNYVNTNLLITGQQEPANGNAAFAMIEADKIIAGNMGGEAPAISSFDYIEYSQSRLDCGANPVNLTEDIIDAREDLNFIVSMMWHWNAPLSTLIDSNCDESEPDNQKWWSGFYSTATTIDLAAVLAAGPGNAVYDALIADMDNIAAELQKFEDAGVPVLWRPLHESAGNWFWWGNSTAAAYVELWRLMFDRFTTTHGLDNLLWVWTAETQNSAWLDFYPGDAYVDIVGVDAYETETSSYAGKWNDVFGEFNGNKLVALTEVGLVPDVSVMHGANVWFAYFVTWNSGGEWGPDNSNNIETTFSSDEVINRADLPGGIVKVGAGIWEGFGYPPAGWHAQVAWTTVDGAATLSNGWSMDGQWSLGAQVDVAAGNNIILQTYPEGGIDVTGADSIEVTVNVTGVGGDAQIFFKTDDVGEGWDGPFVSVTGPTVVTVSLDPADHTGVTGEVTILNGMGVRLENVTGAPATANYYIDQIKLITGVTEEVIYSFEPDAGDGWHGQVSWTTDNLISTSTEWAASGARSLAFFHDLEVGDTNIVMQAYPEGGIDVRCKTQVTVTANTNNALSDAQIFFKTNDVGEGWNAAFVEMDGVNPAVLTASLVAADQGLSGDATFLSGIGVRFEGLTVPAAGAEFYIDKITLTGPSWNGAACDATVVDRTIYDFENTGQWEFQVNWTPADGIRLSSDWVADGVWSLNGTYDMTQGHPDTGAAATDVILQVYPTDGIYLEDGITTMRVTVSVLDAGAGVTAHIFSKSDVSSWEATAPVAVADGATVELTQDITIHDGWVEGFGIRFNSFDVTATDAKYYIDSVEFE